MAVFSPGVSLRDGDQLPPTKLNDLLDLATFTGLGYTNFAGGTGAVFIYGNVAPPIRRGLFWYDTTAGAEGLKYAFVSASFASVSKWLYLTPRREMICWTDSATSMGFPMYIGRGNGAFYQNGLNGRIFDGIFFPSAWHADDATRAHPLLVFPTEHAAASSPVVCAWAGFIRSTNLANSNPLEGDALYLNLASMSGRLTHGDPHAATRSQAWGICNLSTGALVSDVPTTIWGAGPAYEDRA